VSHSTLAAYYRTAHELVSTHKYSLTEIEEMIPYERDLAVEMILDDLEKEQNGAA
jgi:hypothetical protein